MNPRHNPKSLPTWNSSFKSSRDSKSEGWNSRRGFKQNTWRMENKKPEDSKPKETNNSVPSESKPEIPPEVIQQLQEAIKRLGNLGPGFEDPGTIAVEILKWYIEVKVELDGIHKRLSEREIVTGAHSALGYKAGWRMKFYKALRGKHGVLKLIFGEGNGVPMPDKDFDILFRKLNPDSKTDTIVRRGNETAHGYTIEKARSCTNDESLHRVLNVLGEGQPATKEIREASIVARSRLLKAYPGLAMGRGG